MKSRTTIILLTVMALLAFTACNKPAMPDNNNIVAEVGTAKLYRSELQSVIRFELISAEDSTQMARDYINKWIKQQLLVAEAEKSLGYNNSDIQKELERYRQDLLIHKFKKQKFEQLDESSIKPDETLEYYNNNLKLFVLDNAIVQVKYIIFPVEVDLTADFKKKLVSSNESDITECEDFIFKFAKKYDDFNGEWLYFDYLKELTSLDISDNIKFLKKNEIIEVIKDADKHIIVINNYMLPSEQAPIEFVSPRINSLILNGKKLDFLREIKDSLYNDALKYNKFRVFN